MIYLSWQVSDRDIPDKSKMKSIWNVHSGGPVRTVYLLQPNGESSIEESAYDGRGVFGGVDAFVWLAERNLSANVLRTLRRSDWPSAVQAAGHRLIYATAYRDRKTGQLWAPGDTGWLLDRPDIWSFGDSESEILARLGMTSEDAFRASRFEEVFYGAPLKYPLKFSFKRNGIYERLPAAKVCPYNGYSGPPTK